MFKVGVTRDLITASGEPCFNPVAFDELAANPDIEWEWLEDCDEITADHCAAYDALHVNLPRVTAASVARDDCRVKIIARNGVGYDTVDVAALAEKGILTTNTPLAIRRPVAIAALTHIFALTGKLFTKDRLVRDGRWNDRVEHMGVGLTTRTLGVVGAGGIGRELIGLADPFFDRILFSDPHIGEVAGAERASFDALLTGSDVVVVCCLLEDETRHMFDALAFARMKPTAFFVNVARGPIHDEAALIDALRSGQIAGAGLDVTEVEPIANDSPLMTMDNTIITAHSLCWTDECFQDIARSALRSIVAPSIALRTWARFLRELLALAAIPSRQLQTS
ncbi:MAG: NAD(P)-dependent oxidoreductase, partial [Pseudomonadota bacterium]